LAFEEAATLTCSGLTAFNALFGLRGREVKAGDWVLVQGTGGVSIAALQFAVAAGANVIATTSSELKTDRLKALGAKEVVNYRSTPAWGQAARESTPNSRGYDFVVDIAGDVTLRQSIEAVRTDGVLVVAGMVGGAAERGVPIMSVLAHPCIVRGIILGTREQFREMVRFVDEKKIQPVVDEKVFALEDAKEAMRMLERQEHFSKVTVKLR
jgi:NADPH:quinone reductase-like Zn-dependent oxidoreductase